MGALAGVGGNAKIENFGSSLVQLVPVIHIAARGCISCSSVIACTMGISY